MPRKWVKETLHQDALMNFVSKSMNWIMTNKENAVIGGIIIIAIVIFIPFIISHQSKMETEVMTLVSQGELLGAQRQYDRALSFLDQALAKNRKKTNILALYYKGNLLYLIGRYQEAITAYNRYLDSYKKEILTTDVMIGLSKAYEQAGNYDKAISICNDFISNYPEHPFIPDVFQTLGFCYEAAGRNDEAIRTYQKISSLYPGEIWQETADARLKTLGISVQSNQ